MNIWSTSTLLGMFAYAQFMVDWNIDSKLDIFPQFREFLHFYEHAYYIYIYKFHEWRVYFSVVCLFVRNQYRVRSR